MLFLNGHGPNESDEHIEEKQVKIGATAGRHQTMMLNKEEQKEMKLM